MPGGDALTTEPRAHRNLQCLKERITPMLEILFNKDRVQREVSCKYK